MQFPRASQGFLVRSWPLSWPDGKGRDFSGNHRLGADGPGRYPASRVRPDRCDVRSLRRRLQPGPAAQALRRGAGSATHHQNRRVRVVNPNPLHRKAEKTDQTRQIGHKPRVFQHVRREDREIRTTVHALPRPAMAFSSESPRRETAGADPSRGTKFGCPNLLRIVARLASPLPPRSRCGNI